MRSGHRPHLTLLASIGLALSLSALGCRKEAPTQKAPEAGVEAKSSEAPKESAAPAAEENKERGGRRQVAVYLDGEPIAAMRYGELPKKVQEVWVEAGIDEGEGIPKYRRFRLAEYLEALGIKLSRLKGILLGSGRGRLAAIEPKELIKHRQEMMFSFTGDTSGGVEMHYAPKIKSNDVIDKLTSIYLFQNKEAPIWRPEKKIYEIKGEPMTRIPYIEEPLKNGTRIYFDDKLRAIVKRKHLIGDEVGNKEGKDKESPTVSLRAYLINLDIPVAKAKYIELVASDRVEKTLRPEELQSAQMSVVAHSGGKVRILPADVEPQAIRLYSKVPKANAPAKAP